VANYLNHELSQIIRDIAYGKGRTQKLRGLIQRLKSEQAQLEERLRQLPQEISEAETALAEIVAKVQETKKKAQHKYAGLPIEDIRAVIPTPRQITWHHGEFKRELVSVLRSANGPVSTRQLMDYCSARFGIVEIQGTKRNKLRDQVSRRLKEMVDKGWLQRLEGPHPTSPAYWLWIGTGD
jgi:DNA repair exonuclease SbcCD ATPase subunit